jgi:E3 ubiquitin-protein ligase RNF115/126
MFHPGMNLQTMLEQLMSGMHHNPVPDDLLEELPQFTLDDVNRLPAEKKDCVICLTAFEKGNQVLILPCTHLFHPNCIKDWFKTNNTCPICKFTIDGDSLN